MGLQGRVRFQALFPGLREEVAWVELEGGGGFPCGGHCDATMTGRVVVSASFRWSGLGEGREVGEAMLCVIYIEVPSAHHERKKRAPNLTRTRN